MRLILASASPRRKDLLAQIGEKTDRIDAKTKALKGLAAESGMARRLRTMPGVGPLTALAIEDALSNLEN